MNYIQKLMETLEVGDWSNLPGTYVRVKKDSTLGPIIAIGHIVKDQWFDPKVDLVEFLNN